LTRPSTPVADGDLEAAVTAYQAGARHRSRLRRRARGPVDGPRGPRPFDEAIAAATRVAELQPDEILSYTNVSRIYQKAGDVPKAEEWAAKGRMLDWKQQLKTGKPPGA
jgi:hypothetical protein